MNRAPRRLLVDVAPLEEGPEHVARLEDPPVDREPLERPLDHEGGGRLVEILAQEHGVDHELRVLLAPPAVEPREAELDRAPRLRGVELGAGQSGSRT